MAPNVTTVIIVPLSAIAMTPELLRIKTTISPGTIPVIVMFALPAIAPENVIWQLPKVLKVEFNTVIKYRI